MDFRVFIFIGQSLLSHAQYAPDLLPELVAVTSLFAFSRDVILSFELSAPGPSSLTFTQIPRMSYESFYCVSPHGAASIFSIGAGSS